MVNYLRNNSIRKPGEVRFIGNRTNIPRLRGLHGNKRSRKVLKEGDMTVWSISGDSKKNWKSVEDIPLEICLHIGDRGHQTVVPDQRAGGIPFDTHLRCPGKCLNEREI
jgi:hypothetical protein